MGGTVATLNLIAILVGLLGQYGPQLVQGVTDLINGNPKLQDETDEAYTARINALSDAKLADAQRNDDAVIADVDSGAPKA